MSVQITDELRVLVEAEVASAIESMKKLDDSVEKTEKKTNKLDDALKSLEKKALILSAAVVGAGGAAVKFAANNETLRTSLEVLLGSAEQAGAIFEEWKRFGAATPLSVEEIGSAGKSLIAFGIGAKEVTDTMRRLGNVAQGIGARLGDVAEVYGKVRVQGQLFSYDLNHFQRRGIPVMQSLAKVLGTTEAAIKEMVTQGKIGFPELEQAFKIMTENGGQFEGMMERLSQTTAGKFSTAMDNAQQAAASFGELLLPLVNDVLDSVTNLMDGFINMDAGTKRFILGFGGVIAISGPTIAALHGINKAIAVLKKSHPEIIAITAAIAGLGAVVGGINALSHSYENLRDNLNLTKSAADSLLTSFSQGNDAKLLDVKTTRELIRLYPELRHEIESYNTTVGQAATLVDAARIERAKKAAQDQLDLITKAQAAIKDIEESEMGQWDKDFAIGQRLRDIEIYKAKAKELLNAVGYDLGRYNTIVLKPQPVDIPDYNNSLNPPSTDDSAKKRWQEWYSEITKVDLAAVNKMRDQGEALGTLFVESLDSGMTQSRQIAETLGAEFDVADALRGQRDDIERAINELLAISPSEIDDPFELKEKVFDPLVEDWKKKTAEIRDADFVKEVEALEKKIKDFKKEEGELAEAAALANGYLPEQAEKIGELTQQYADLSKTSEESITSLEDVFENILEKHTELTEEVRESIASIAASMAEISFDGVLKGLEDIGYALAQNEDAGKAFKAAMADMIRSMLDMLPAMFLQAGLQLIIDRQWPMGLAFIAMAGSTALLNGFTKGLLNEEEEETASAHGNAFGVSGVMPYARGGAFTNQLVTSPTYFRHGRGFGVMGEAGPEAVMPLRRLGNGNLGVEASGIGGPQVTVNIYNNSGEPVSREEKTDQNGNRQIDIMIGEIVGGQISSGRHDSAIESRFDGLRRRGH